MTTTFQRWDVCEEQLMSKTVQVEWSLNRAPDVPPSSENFLHFSSLRCLLLSRKFYYRSNKNKVDSVEAGYLIIAHLLP